MAPHISGPDQLLPFRIGRVRKDPKLGLQLLMLADKFLEVGSVCYLLSIPVSECTYNTGDFLVASAVWVLESFMTLHIIIVDLYFPPTRAQTAEVPEGLLRNINCFHATMCRFGLGSNDISENRILGLLSGLSILLGCYAMAFLNRCCYEVLRRISWMPQYVTSWL